MLNDLYTYLAADTTLRGLITGATAAEPRIYPEVAPEDAAAPYLIYGTTREGSADEVMDEMTVQISVFGNQFDAASVNNIVNRLKVMLDKQDQIQGKIASSTYYIYWAKHIGGMTDFVRDTREYHRAEMFAFKFKLK
jgi:hypothetical protein